MAVCISREFGSISQTCGLASWGWTTNDPDWNLVMDCLFQDMDVEMILWPGPLVGRWETAAEVDRHTPIDHLPPAWFEWFLNVEPRPGR
jgi:hypothetical protein